MSLTDELFRSYRDLRCHFEPAVARQAGLAGYEGMIGTYDHEAVGEHVAALRSIIGAIEDLDVDTLDEEIDRTALLDEMRARADALQRERPEIRNPAFWVLQLGRAFHDPLGSADHAALQDRLEAVGPYLQAARSTLTDPPPFLLDTAFALLPEVEEAITRAGTMAEGSSDHLTEALKALEEFRTALSTEVGVELDAHALGIGEEAFEHRLHHEHALRGTAAEAWRILMHRVEEQETAIEDAAAAIDPHAPWREVAERAAASEEMSDRPGAIRAARQLAVDFLERAGFPEGGWGAGDLAVADLQGLEAILDPWGGYRREETETAAGQICLGELTYPWIGATTAVAWWGTPGGHQLAQAQQRLGSEVRRWSRSPGMTVGWTLHAGRYMEEIGFFTDPADLLRHRVFRLRATHLALVDIGIHTRQWSALQGLEHLATHLPYPRELLLADVRRIAMEPTAAIAASLGEKAIESLRECWIEEGRAGGAIGCYRALLAYGGIPVALARWGMGIDE